MIPRILSGDVLLKAPSTAMAAPPNLTEQERQIEEHPGEFVRYAEPRPVETVPPPARLSELERVIEKGLGTFIEVGNALSEIRENRLYLQTHATFEDYCRDRWQMTINYADRLMLAGRTVDNLKATVPIGTPMPTNESQTRPLSRLEPGDQPAAWMEATKDTDHPTAKQVEQEVQKVIEADQNDDTVRLTKIASQLRMPYAMLRKFVKGRKFPIFRIEGGFWAVTQETANLIVREAPKQPAKSVIDVEANPVQPTGEYPEHLVHEFTPGTVDLSAPDWNERDRSLRDKMKAYVAAKIEVLQWIGLGAYDAQSVWKAIDIACLEASDEMLDMTLNEIASATKLDLEAARREYA